VDSSTDNPIHFTASNYGTLTANFQQSLSLKQYLAIILGPVSVVSIFVSWLFRNRERRYLNRYVTTINSVINTIDSASFEWRKKRNYATIYKGRISEAHYNVLDKIILTI